MICCQNTYQIEELVVVVNWWQNTYQIIFIVINYKFLILILIIFQTVMAFSSVLVVPLRLWVFIKFWSLTNIIYFHLPWSFRVHILLEWGVLYQEYTSLPGPIIFLIRQGEVYGLNHRFFLQSSDCICF